MVGTDPEFIEKLATLMEGGVATACTVWAGVWAMTVDGAPDGAGAGAFTGVGEVVVHLVSR